MTLQWKLRENQTEQPGLQRRAVNACPRTLMVALLTLCALCMAVPASAEDCVIEIPAPPSPDRVLNKVGGFFHRLFNGDKNRRSRSLDEDENRDASVTPSAPPVEDGTTRPVKTKSTSNSQST